jgi:NTE family protein
MFKNLYPLLIALLSFATPAWAAEELAYLPTPSATYADFVSPQAVQARKTRPTIALALGGGGVRGAAHIGVLRVFQRENLPVDLIVGSSMGAIVGGMYAAGVSLETLEELFRDRSLFKAYTPVSDTLKLMTIPGSMLMRSAKLAIGLRTNTIGLHSSNKIASFVDRHVSPYRRNIEHAEIPFVAVATNLLDGKPYSLEYGDLGRAVQASSAIPFYVKPVEIDGKFLVDGALRSNVPAVQARQSRADLVIAVNVDEDLQDIKPATLRRVTPYGNRILSIILAEVDGHHSDIADIEIRPALSPMPIYSRSVRDAERAIRAGEEAAENALPQIKLMLNSKLAAGEKSQAATMQF